MPFKEILFEHITYFNTNLLTHQKTTTQKIRNGAFINENKDDNVNEEEAHRIYSWTKHYKQYLSFCLRSF